jgi:multimeric flavodoxin WrbA
MKVLAINGSPRKSRNTATLLRKVLEGASSRGFETELVDLYDLDFSGCVSCFACKRKGGNSYGECALHDALTPILEKARDADALVLGSPNYIGGVSGRMKSFIERFVYPYIVYGRRWSSLFPKRIPVVLVYTMSSSKPWMRLLGYDKPLRFLKAIMNLFIGPTRLLVVNDTSMFDDYSKYFSERFDPAKKARIKERLFPIECEKAYKLGSEMAPR